MPEIYSPSNAYSTFFKGVIGPSYSYQQNKSSNEPPKQNVSTPSILRKLGNVDGAQFKVFSNVKDSSDSLLGNSPLISDRRRIEYFSSGIAKNLSIQVQQAFKYISEKVDPGAFSEKAKIHLKSLFEELPLKCRDNLWVIHKIKEEFLSDLDERIRPLFQQLIEGFMSIHKELFPSRDAWPEFDADGKKEAEVQKRITEFVDGKDGASSLFQIIDTLAKIDQRVTV